MTRLGIAVWAVWGAALGALFAALGSDPVWAGVLLGGFTNGALAYSMRIRTFPA